MALVFYAGHGLQVDGENYLVPVDVDGQEEDVGIELVESVAPGDVLVCHAGVALEKATVDA